MMLLEQLSILERLHFLIQRKSTGTPKQLAQRLGVSRSSAFNYLNSLKKLGAPIAYCKNRQSYFYEDQFSFFSSVMEAVQNNWTGMN